MFMTKVRIGKVFRCVLSCCKEEEVEFLGACQGQEVGQYLEQCTFDTRRKRERVQNSTGEETWSMSRRGYCYC